MTTVYNDKDLMDVYKQRQKTLFIFLGVTFAYMVFCIAWLIYHISLPYADSRAMLPKALVFVVTALYVMFAFPYMGIKFSRVNRYYKALNNFSTGMKNEEKNYFYCFEEHSMQKDNIDVTYCIFESWNKKKQEWQERIAYFDPEKPTPDFGSGDHVQYIVQSNFILQYKVLERGVFEFEEMTIEEELGIKTTQLEEIQETQETTTEE